MAQVYTTSVPASLVDDDDENFDRTKTKNGGGGLLGPTLCAILAVASIAFLIVYLAHIGARIEAHTKRLSDEVVRLQLEVNQVELENDRSLEEKETLAKEAQDAKIELAWEAQHVRNQDYSEHLLYLEMEGQMKRDHEAVRKAGSDVAMASARTSEQLFKTNQENIRLKVTLGRALEELADAREEHSPAPDQDTERKLRGQSPYRPGDSIEIIEYQEGKIALRPGIVSDVHPNGSYNLVKLESSIMIPNVERKDFQTYRVYREGATAYYKTKDRGVYAPITIVKFLPGSARRGFEVHGSYEVRFDGDDDRPERVGEVMAMRIHRYAADGEVGGTESTSRVRA